MIIVQKSIIGYKAISAWILKTCVRKFADCDVSFIAEHCISDVSIAVKAVHQDHPDRAENINVDQKIKETQLGIDVNQ
ncbi:MAG: hypothetical protein ACI32N_03210 [Bulleidia sp.]